MCLLVQQESRCRHVSFWLRQQRIQCREMLVLSIFVFDSCPLSTISKF